MGLHICACPPAVTALPMRHIVFWRLQVKLSRQTDRLTLENGYIKVRATLLKPSIDQLMGCFDGDGEYKSVLSETSDKSTVCLQEHEFTHPLSDLAQSDTFAASLFIVDMWIAG